MLQPVVVHRVTHPLAERGVLVVQKRGLTDADMTGLPADDVGVAQHAPCLDEQGSVLGAPRQQRRNLFGEQRAVLRFGGRDSDLVVFLRGPLRSDPAACELALGEVDFEAGEHDVRTADEGVVVTGAQLFEQAVPLLRRNIVHHGRHVQLAGLLRTDLRHRQYVGICLQLRADRVGDGDDALRGGDPTESAEHPAQRGVDHLARRHLGAELHGPGVDDAPVGQRLHERRSSLVGEKLQEVQGSAYGEPSSLSLPKVGRAALLFNVRQ